MIKKMLSVVVLLLAGAVSSFGVCTGGGTVSSGLVSYPSFASVFIAGISGCHIVITNVTADVSSVSATSALSTDVVVSHGGTSCATASGNNLTGAMGIVGGFGQTDHYNSGTVNITTGGTGFGLCTEVATTEVGVDESVTVTYSITP